MDEGIGLQGLAALQARELAGGKRPLVGEGLRVAAVFLLVGLTSALISASAALVIAAQVERSQQAVLEEEEVTPNPEPVRQIPAKKVTIKETETGWYLLELSDGARGWVFARYASLE